MVTVSSARLGEGIPDEWIMVRLVSRGNGAARRIALITVTWHEVHVGLPSYSEWLHQLDECWIRGAAQRPWCHSGGRTAGTIRWCGVTTGPRICGDYAVLRIT